MAPLLLAVSIVLAAPVPKDAKPPKPALDGRWQLTAYHFPGGNVVDVTQHWAIDGNTITIDQSSRKAPPGVIPITLDLKASPMRIDFDNGTGSKGIFEVKGDTLILCMSRKDRPTDFTPAADQVKYILKRVTDGK